MKIAIIGTRGIPANYGGFETFAEECSVGLAARGHEVTVYGRSHYVPKNLNSYRGVQIVVLPTLKWKYTDTLFHTFLSIFHSLFGRYDLILICNAANSIFAWIPHMVGTRVALNVDGIERKRKKWNRLGQSYYRICEYLSTRFPDVIITDAAVIERYYRERYNAGSVFIPYGARTERTESREVLDQFDLSPKEYFLYVSRFEPENNAHLVVKAFEKVQTQKKLVMLGSAPYSAKYIERVRNTRDSRILFPGAIYGKGYRELQTHSFCYIHATEVGGTHPALIEAMGQAGLIVANDTPENAETLGGTGILYRRNNGDDLTRCLQELADHPELHATLRSAALERARSVYSWEQVINQYERLFVKMVKQPESGTRSTS